jgi:hypothetical protein
MNLKQYIRNDQEFLIYIHTPSAEWEKYDHNRHGSPELIQHNYVVAYSNGEILDNRANTFDIPPNTYYIEILERKSKPELMPPCNKDSRVSIQNEPSAYPRQGNYCTRIQNIGNLPFKIRRFAAFAKTSFFGKYRLNTISNTWFTEKQFRNWFNQKTEWIMPNTEVADQDNYGSGNGFWVFEIEFPNGEIVIVKAKLPK